MKYSNSGQTISSSLHSQSQLCRSFANERTKANRCWREKNWSNCPHQSINQTMWPPTLSFSDDEITADFELEFGLMYVYVDCKSIEKSPSTTGNLVTAECRCKTQRHNVINLKGFRCKNNLLAYKSLKLVGFMRYIYNYWSTQTCGEGETY